MGSEEELPNCLKPPDRLRYYADLLQSRQRWARGWTIVFVTALAIVVAVLWLLSAQIDVAQIKPFFAIYAVVAVAFLAAGTAAGVVEYRRRKEIMELLEVLREEAKENATYE